METRLQSTKLKTLLLFSPQNKYIASKPNMSSGKVIGNLCLFLIDLLFLNAPCLVRSGLKSFLGILIVGIVSNLRIKRMTFNVNLISQKSVLILNKNTSVISKHLNEKERALRKIHHLDINRTIWIPRNVLNSMQISSIQWVGLKQEEFYDSINQSTINISSNQTENEYNHSLVNPELFVCKVVAINEKEEEAENLLQIKAQDEDPFIIMTSTGCYNLRKKFGLPPIDLNNEIKMKLKVIPLLTDPYLKKDSKEKQTSFWYFSPFKAKSVKLSKLKSCYKEISNEECDILLKDYFQNTKHLVCGDVISIPYSENSFDRESEDYYLEFIVDEIEANWDETGSKSHPKAKGLEKIYKVSSKSTCLYLSGQLINSFHVPLSKREYYFDRNLQHGQTVLIPKVFDPFLDQMQYLFSSAIKMQLGCPNDNKLWPTLLIHGGIGTGKFFICSSLAKRLGLNFYTINGVSLVGDTSAYTEAKLKALGEKVKSIIPCLIYIKNAHLIGKDKEGQEDKRVILAFKELLLDIQKSMKIVKPTDPEAELVSNPTTSSASMSINLEKSKGYVMGAFVVGSSTTPEEISGSLRHAFVHKIEIPLTIPNDELVSTFLWLLGTGNVIPSSCLNLKAWVEKSCHGVKRKFSDLKACLAYAARKGYGEAIADKERENENNSQECPPKSSNIMAIKSLEISEDNLDYGLEMIDKVLKGVSTAARIPNVTWDDIGGLGLIKSELINSIQLPLRFPKLFTSGIKRSGILLYGAPGTGKTLIAKAVATEFKLSFLSVKGPELLNMYVGQSEQNVREVFQRARESAPCVVFFDELDSLAPNRGKSGDSGGVMDRVVSQILAELDGTHSTPNVFIIGATNRPDLIDPALLRPGRFDKLLYVGINEDQDSKKKILKALTRKFSLGKTIDFDEIANELPKGMTGADIYSLCSDAYMTSVSRCISKIHDITINDGENDEAAEDNNMDVVVSQEDFNEALTRITVSLSPSEQQKYEELKGMMR